jgi:hypothetical protein
VYTFGHLSGNDFLAGAWSLWVGQTCMLGRAMPGRPIKLPSESAMSTVRLGITVTGLYGLVTMGLMIVFSP